MLIKGFCPSTIWGAETHWDFTRGSRVDGVASSISCLHPGRSSLNLRNHWLWGECFLQPSGTFLEFLISTSFLLQNNTTWKKHIMAIPSSCGTFRLGKCWEISLQNAEVNSKLSIILSWFLSQITPRAKEKNGQVFSWHQIQIFWESVQTKTGESRHINSLFFYSGQIMYGPQPRSPFWMVVE